MLSLWEHLYFRFHAALNGLKLLPPPSSLEKILYTRQSVSQLPVVHVGLRNVLDECNAQLDVGTEVQEIKPAQLTAKTNRLYAI